jgi:hypothetical protein
MPRSAPHFEALAPALPPADDLGPCPFPSGMEARAWEQFREEIPWISKRDRALLECACILRALIASGEDKDPKTIMKLAALISKLGATPTDQSKVTAKEPESNDPADKFFQ